MSQNSIEDSSNATYIHTYIQYIHTYIYIRTHAHKRTHTHTCTHALQNKAYTLQNIVHTCIRQVDFFISSPSAGLMNFPESTSTGSEVKNGSRLGRLVLREPNKANPGIANSGGPGYWRIYSTYLSMCKK